jgi:hypothetical protein
LRASDSCAYRSSNIRDLCPRIVETVLMSTFAATKRVAAWLALVFFVLFLLLRRGRLW